MKFREAPKAFKFAAFFQVVSIVLLGLMFAVGFDTEDTHILGALVATSVGAQALAALATFMGLTSQDVLRIYMPRKV